VVPTLLLMLEGPGVRGLRLGLVGRALGGRARASRHM
jgi:hypothetical protein